MRLFLRRALQRIGLALALIMAGAGMAAAAPDWQVVPGDMTLGSPKARVTVIEYASASCPHCAAFNNEVFPAFKAKYIDTGKVRYVFREFLTPPEQLAAIGFLLARCAGEAKYWTVLDQFFHDQTEIYTTHQVEGVVLRIAKSVGLTEPQVEACIDSKPALDALNARMQTALNAKINSTPTFLINGVEFHEQSGKETDLASLSAALDPLLAPAPPHRRR